MITFKFYFHSDFLLYHAVLYSITVLYCAISYSMISIQWLMSQEVET